MRAAGRPSHGPLGLGGAPAGARGRQRVRDLARRRADVVPLPPPVRRPAAARAAADLAREVVSLHRAAAQWHEQEGFVVEAIRHAQAARDWPLASRLLADNHLDLTLDGRTGEVRELLSAFPRRRGRRRTRSWRWSSPPRACWKANREESAEYLRARRAAGRRGRRRAPAALRRAAGRAHAGDRALARRPRDRPARRCPRWRRRWPRSPPGDRALSQELRAVALQNLGVAELWSSRLDEARGHLEQALALARRARRPWLEISPLGHLGVAGPWTGRSLLGRARGSARRRCSIADAHGWNEDPIVVTPLATGAMALLWLGRLDEAEQWIERAQRTLQPGRGARHRADRGPRPWPPSAGAGPARRGA